MELKRIFGDRVRLFDCLGSLLALALYLVIFWVLAFQVAPALLRSLPKWPELLRRPYTPSVLDESLPVVFEPIPASNISSDQNNPSQGGPLAPSSRLPDKTTKILVDAVSPKS